MHWLLVALRILLFVSAAGAVGWLVGYPLAGILFAAFAFLLFWAYQMSQLQAWLARIDDPPPDLLGNWGEIVSRIYKLQREAAASQQQLQSTVNYLLESFSSMRDGVVIVQESGAIRWSNRAAEKLLGLRYPEDVGQAVTNLVRYPEFSAFVNRGEYSKPLYFLADGGRKRQLNVVITRFAEGDMLLFVRDVTDRFQIDQMRRDFVGNVSHELRTPLTVITGYLGTFLESPGDLPPKLVKPLQQMEQQAQRMEGILKDLLWLSRIESEERVEKRESVDVAALLEELREEIHAAHPDRKIVCESSCQERIMGDYRELRSAISNLVMNAIKYSDDNSTVTVKWYDDRDCCRLEVSDSGIGIDAKHLPRLTERFYRVDDSRSSATGGTGLGLAIVKHVAASHGATLKVESQLGKGSTFALVFPLRREIEGQSEKRI